MGSQYTRGKASWSLGNITALYGMIPGSHYISKLYADRYGATNYKMHFADRSKLSRHRRSSHLKNRYIGATFCAALRTQAKSNRQLTSIQHHIILVMIIFSAVKCDIVYIVITTSVDPGQHMSTSQLYFATRTAFGVLI
jgi:hypothetical protein